MKSNDQWSGGGTQSDEANGLRFLCGFCSNPLSFEDGGRQQGREVLRDFVGTRVEKFKGRQVAEGCPAGYSHDFQLSAELAFYPSKAS